MKEDDNLREVSPSSTHPKWKTSNKAAHNASSNFEDILRSSNVENLTTVDNIAETPQNTNKVTEEASTNNTTANKAPEASNKAATKTKEALTNDDAPHQTKKAKEETSGEMTPVNRTNAENAPNAVIDDEDTAMRSNNPPIRPALQPATLSPNATLQESILQEMEMELDAEEPF